MKTNKHLLAWFAVTIAVFMWGLSFLSIKVTVTVLPTMTQALLRLIIASITLFIMMRLIEPETKLNKQDIPMFIIAGLLGITLYFFFENSGMKRISASAASLIIAVVPILTIIGDAIVFKEPMTKRKLLSVMISFAGVYFIVGGNNSNNYEFWGYILMLGAAISWVVYTLVTKSLFRKYSELAIVYYQTIFGTITLIPFAFFEKTNWEAVDVSIILNLLFLGIFCSALATYLYVISMDIIGVSICSLMMNLIPIVAVTTSFFVLKEHITFQQIIGGILVIGAVCICSFKSKFEMVDFQNQEDKEIMLG